MTRGLLWDFHTRLETDKLSGSPVVLAPEQIEAGLLSYMCEYCEGLRKTDLAKVCNSAASRKCVSENPPLLLPLPLANVHGHFTESATSPILSSHTCN